MEPGGAKRQREALRNHFALRLVELSPREHLDVGAGGGELSRAVLARGVRSIALEPGPARDSWAGLSVLRGTAGCLPFRDNSFDWVSLRHVPHHLEDFPAAAREAWRVARSGVLLAEPWFDQTQADQRFALRADRWLKHQDRRLGRYHGAPLSADELTAALPPGARRRETEIETYRPERAWDVDSLEDEARKATGGLPPLEQELSELQQLLEFARRGAMTLPGTLILTARKG